MNAVVEFKSQAGPAQVGDYFAPVDFDQITAAIRAYNLDLQRMTEMNAVMTGNDYGDVMRHFMEGNFHDNRNIITSRYCNLSEIFSLENAVKHLDASYWSKVFRLTDVYDCMPQKRRDEWNQQIEKMNTPKFEEDTVRLTIKTLLDSRLQFLSERVDGIFRNLSHNHVTNQPEGFSKRMILEYVIGSYDMVNYSKAGYIDDLRAVIGRFLGRGELKWRSSEKLIKKAMDRSGQWLLIDGGSIKLRVYKKGTCHLEIHPDIAWRLNEILAALYPTAIPTSFTKRPAQRKNKDFDLMLDTLPFEVVHMLSELKSSVRPAEGKLYYLDTKMYGKEATKKYLEVIELIEGTVDGNKVTFEYGASSVLDHIVTTGCIPEFKSHQFYSTTKKLANWAVGFADIQENDLCLEPSAGTGSLACLMPKDRTVCVEVNHMNCRVLEGKGMANVIRADFIEFAKDTALRFDKIVMNPPFSEGRAKAHTLAAANLLKYKGKLVAILPASMRGGSVLGDTFEHTWTKTLEKEFENTDANVVILIAHRKADFA